MKAWFLLAIASCLLVLAAPALADGKGPALEVSSFEDPEDFFSLSITATDEDGIKLVRYRSNLISPWKNACSFGCGRDLEKECKFKDDFTEKRVNEVEAEDCNGKKSYWRRIETSRHVSFDVDKPNATITSVKTLNLEDADGKEPDVEDFEVKAAGKGTRVTNKKPFTKKDAKKTGVAEVVVDPEGEDYYFTLEFLIDPAEIPALSPPLLALLGALVLAAGLLVLRLR